MIKKELNISLIIPSFYPATVYGGPIFSSLHTSKALASRGHKIMVSTTNANRPNRLTENTKIWHEIETNIFVRYYFDTVLERFSFPLFNNIKKDISNSDIVHVQYTFSTPTPMAFYYASKLNKKIVFSPRGALAPWILNNGLKFKRQWIDWLIRPFAERIYFHATSEQERKEIIELFPESSVFTIPNGIAWGEFQIHDSLSKREYLKVFTDLDSNGSIDFLVISMGRLQKKKGFDILINSFDEFLKFYPNSYLLIAGEDDGEKKELDQQIQRLNLKSSVFFIGEIAGQKKINFLANADMFVLPSHNENFGNVYAEALAAGTPVIASKNTPWQQVEVYNCGLHVNNNVKETTKAMKTLAEKDLKVMGANGRSYIKRLDWDNIGKMFADKYFEILSSKDF